MLDRKPNPYQGLPDAAFWKSAIATRSMYDIDGVWDPKFEIRRRTRMATFGSCFAQHIGRALRKRRHSWLITELAPPGLGEANKRLFNYETFTCRTGAIYTTSLLKQWLAWAAGEAGPPAEVWERDGRFFDPFRPRIEPRGFASREELVASRAETIRALREAVEKANVFVYTLGLTESWWNAAGGYEYPVCPGVAAGTFDPDLHQFRNQGFAEISRALLLAIATLRKINPKVKVLLTVSPVPLTATKSGRHVLTATMASKSILRAVADECSSRRGHVDYFPSYELVASPPFRANFFEPNMRDVAMHGVDFVMDAFFRSIVAKFGEEPDPKAAAPVRSAADREELVCEELLLEAFGARSGAA